MTPETAQSPTAEDDRLSRWLAAAGAPAEFGDRIVATLGRAAADRIAENPWSVLEVPGVSPPAADALAQAVTAAARTSAQPQGGVSSSTSGPESELGSASESGATQPDSHHRTRALISWLVRRAAAGGSTAQSAAGVAKALDELGVADTAGTIADAIDAGVVLAFAVPLSLPDDAGEAEADAFEELDGADDDDPASMLTSDRTLLALERWAFAEQAVAEAAQRLAATPEPIAKAADSATESAADPAGPTGEQPNQAPEQLTAAVRQNGLTLATGVTAADLAGLTATFPGALLVSPSAAGLRALTAAHPRTLPDHASALAANPERLAQAEVLILADAQLLDLELGATLLEGAADGAHVLLAGDPATLPATAPGLLFRDLLELDEPEFGGRLPRVELKRRPTGPRSALADAVRHGGLPPQELLKGPDGSPPEVVIVPVRDPVEAVHRAVQLVTESIPRVFGLTAMAIQVVAMAGAGPAGAAELNAALKATLNPGPGCCAGFDVGDRVIATAPLAEHGLHGGETGTVRDADADTDSLTVAFDPPHGAELVKLTGADAVRTAVRHAWALTVAEAQGGRWPAVVAVFDGATAPRLTRAQVLSAFSLATEHLSVVHGAGPQLSVAVEQRPDHPRVTRLRHALRD